MDPSFDWRTWVTPGRTSAVRKFLRSTEVARRRQLAICSLLRSTIVFVRTERRTLDDRSFDMIETDGPKC